jgi:hypothetical protein
MLSLTMSKVTIFSLCVFIALAGSVGTQDKGAGAANNAITAAVILEKNLTAGKHTSGCRAWCCGATLAIPVSARSPFLIERLSMML